VATFLDLVMACDAFAESLRKIDDAWDQGLTANQAYPELSQIMQRQCADIYRLADAIAPTTPEEVQALAYIRGVIDQNMVSLIDLVEEMQHDQRLRVVH